ncbi:MAG: hypothetical protein WD689_02045 [Gaiellaceae bacterium]
MIRCGLALIVLVLAGCGGASAPATGEPLGPVQLVEALQEGGLVVYLRHAATDRSQEDTQTSGLTNCDGQRNLTAAGRVQARLIGEPFARSRFPSATFARVSIAARARRPSSRSARSSWSPT